MTETERPSPESHATPALLQSAAPSWRSLPRGVWVLGLVSLLMDVSSEMIHALLPVYLATVLGASMSAIGVIEGIAEATASVVKIFSGAASDWLGNRKILAALGYGLAAFTKPIFPLAGSLGWVVAARFIDRVGKGIRGAPRDALVADISPAEMRGASFGLRQSLDTVGAFVGPVIAIVLMWWSADKFRFVFWMAVTPALLSFALIAFAVREPDRPAGLRKVKNPLSLSEIARLDATYWWIVAVAAVFALARFSEAFLILRAQNVGLPVALLPAVLVVMNVIYALAAYPAGVLSDRVGRFGILLLGLLVLVIADAVLAAVPTVLGTGVGVALWGLHMGLTQGVLSSLVADNAPPELRGSAFGYFNLVSGIAMLAASIMAGALWDRAGPAATFIAGDGFALLAVVALLVLWKRRSTAERARS